MSPDVFSELDYGDTSEPERRRLRRFGLSIAGLAVIASVFAVMLFALPGCAIEAAPVPGPASRPVESRPASSLTTISSMETWAYYKTGYLCHRFSIAKPRTVWINKPTPKTAEAVFAFGSIAIYRLGEYERDDSEIRVWMQASDGSAIPIADLRETWKHEFLHHLDKCMGFDSPKGDHNALFDRRIKDLDL